jgi:hypothetical protein
MEGEGGGTLKREELEDLKLKRGMTSMQVEDRR